MLDQISKVRLASIDSVRAQLRAEVTTLCKSVEPRDVALALLVTSVKHLRWFANKAQNGTLSILFEPNEITLRKKNERDCKSTIAR